MRPARWLALLAALGCGACATYERGRFAAVSTAPLPLRSRVVAERVEGRSCGDPFTQRFNRAVETALAQAPGADALLDVSYSFERLCIVVRGVAVDIE